MLKQDIINQFPQKVHLTVNEFNERDPKHYQKLYGKQAKLLVPRNLSKVLGKTLWSVYSQYGTSLDWDKISTKKVRSTALRRLRFVSYDKERDMVMVRDIKNKEEFELYKHNGSYVSGTGADFTFVFL
jgi:hypothetical protein